MKLKKIGALLLVLCMVFACMPQMMASAEAEMTWINIEAESGDYPAIYRKASNSLTSGGEYIEVSNDSCTAETDATVDWSFVVEKAGRYDVWVLMSKFAGATSVSQPAWGIDANASASNPGTEMTGAVYNFAYAAAHPKYERDFVWVKLETGHNFTAATHTIQYAPQLATNVDTPNRLLAGLDVIRVVPSAWNWTPKANLDDPTIQEWFDVQAEDGTGWVKGSVTTNAAASGGKYIGYDVDRETDGESETITMTFEAPITDTYDMWMVAGQSNINSVAQITITLDGNTYTQPEIAPTNTLYYHSNYKSAGWTTQAMFWHEIGASIALEAGKTYTLKATLPASTHSTLGWFQALDVIRFVPSSWHWTAGADFSAPRRPEWFDLEAEDGTLLITTGTATTSGRSYLKASQWGGTAGNTSTMSFSANAGVYDIWTVVGGHTSGKYAGSYTFTIDSGTDSEIAFGQINMEDIMTLGGDTLYVGEAVASGFDMNMKWVKVASAQEISEGKHTMLAAVTGASNGNGNKFGVIDVVRIVPAEWHWAADTTFNAPTKSEAIHDGSFAWIEGENLTGTNDYAAQVSRGVFAGTHSNGSSLFLNKTGMDDAFVPEFAYNFYVDNAGEYTVWTYGYAYNSTNGGHLGKMYVTVGSNTTTGGAEGTIVTTGEAYSGYGQMRWTPLCGTINLEAGWNEMNVRYTHGGMHHIFCTDVIVFVPKAWNWCPDGEPTDLSGVLANGNNALNTAPILDTLSVYKNLASQIGNEVTEDLSLISYGAAGSTITYTSTNSAISNTGEVTIPTGWYGGDARGTIAATATKSGVSATSSAVNTIVYAIRPIEYTGLTFEGDFTAGSTVTAKFTGVAATTEEEGLTAIGVIAVYDNNGDIASVRLSGEKEITTTAQDITASTTLPSDMTGVVVKGYLWTGLDTIIPISDTIAYGADSAGYDDDLLPLLKAKYDAKKLSDDCFNLGVITDVQTPALTGYQTYNHHYRSIVKASELIELDAIADLGDMIMGSSSDKAATIALLREQSSILAESGLPIFRLRGNHDDNRWAAVNSGDGSVVIDPDEWTEACDVDWATTMDGTTAGNQPYFYKDFADDKIRIISLDGVDIPYEYSGETSVGYTFGFTEAQLEWLANEALDFSDKADKEDWGVIILTHVLSYDYGNTVINFAGFGNIMTAFMNGTSGTYSNTNEKAPVESVSYDFTSQGEMEVICMFNGHTHTDGDGTMWGMKYITTGSSLPDECDAIPDRSLYTKNEDLWDIMTIDRTNRKIYATRFGAGVDREFSY